MPMPARPRSSAVLLVYANPYSALDQEGLPSGYTRHDPLLGRAGSVHHVGAILQQELLEERIPKAPPGMKTPFPARVGDGRQNLWRTTLLYDLSPQRIAHSDYHVARVRDHDLLSADEATSRLCRLSGHTPPAVALSLAREEAITLYRQTYLTDPPVALWPTFTLLGADGQPLALPALGEKVPDAPAPAFDPAACTSAMTTLTETVGQEHAGEVLSLARLVFTLGGGGPRVADTLLALQSLYGARRRAQVLRQTGIDLWDATGLPRSPAEVLLTCAEVAAPDRSTLFAVFPSLLRPVIDHVIEIFSTAPDAKIGADAVRAIFAADTTTTSKTPNPAPRAEGDLPQ